MVRIKEIVDFDDQEELMDTLALDDASAIYEHYRRMRLDSDDFTISASRTYPSTIRIAFQTEFEMLKSEIDATPNVSSDIRQAVDELLAWLQ